jgi:ComF family protein
VSPARRVLGRMLADAITDLEPSFRDDGSLFPQPLLVVPVPLHERKLRQRGFNQSEVIARAALKLKPAGGQFTLAADILVRKRETQSQIGLTRHQRRENMRGAFAVINPQALQEREILLVDDVFTTGTTASECSRVLRRAGAKRVWVATVARTLKAEVQHVIHQEEEETRAALAAHG